MFSHSKKRKGLSIIETMISVILMALAVIVMARLTAIKVAEQSHIDSSYSMFTADAYLSDIYHDFQSAVFITSEYNEDTGRCKLTMDMGVETIKLYEFLPETGYCYLNGVQQFECSAMEVRSAKDSLYVALRLPDSRRLEIDIYK